MHFKLSKEYKRFFENIIAKGGRYSSDLDKFMQFDIYYTCALIGMAARSIDFETGDLGDMVENYPEEYQNCKAQIAGLLIASEAKRQNVKFTSKDLEKMMLLYLDEGSTLLSDLGISTLNAYAYKGAQIYQERIEEKPYYREDFLLNSKQIIDSYMK